MAYPLMCLRAVRLPTRPPLPLRPPAPSYPLTWRTASFPSNRWSGYGHPATTTPAMASNPLPRTSRICPANDRETLRSDGNGRSIESAGQASDSAIAAGSEIGPESTLKVETRVRTPLGLPGKTSPYETLHLPDIHLHLRGARVCSHVPESVGIGLDVEPMRGQSVDITGSSGASGSVERGSAPCPPRPCHAARRCWRSGSDRGTRRG
jgi:hypothetical protein